jgi:hypothetical protein
MAVDERRNPDDLTDQGLWSECAITWQRLHLACAFVAESSDGDEVLRSAPFRWRRGGGAPVEAPDAVASLAALQEALVGEGWELIDEPQEAWYSRRFRRPLVPLTQRIAAYSADSALIAFVESEPGDEAAEPDQATPESAPEADEAERREAERLDTERLEAEQLEAGRQEAERLEAERQEAERLEAERLEAERLEAAQLEAERLEAARLEAERLEAERQEAERLETERLEAERLEAERRETERLEAQRLEAERVEAERQEAERLEAERSEAEQPAAEPESPLQNLITSYAASYDRDLDVRSFYRGEPPQLDPERFARKSRRRRR